MVTIDQYTARWRAVIIHVFLVGWLGSLVCAAQGVGTISGTVTDESGAVVPEAEVLLWANGTVVAETKSDRVGRYELRVPPGSYDLVIGHKGFKPGRGHIEVGLQSAASADVTLEPETTGPDIFRSIGKGIKGIGRIWRSTSQVTAAPTPTPSTPTPPTPTPAPPPAVRTFTDPVWNAWMEFPYSDTPSFSPLTTIGPDTEYSLVVDFSAMAFGGEPGVYSHSASPGIGDWLAKLPATAVTAPVQIVIITDGTFFWPQANDQMVREVEVNVQKLRDVRKTGFSLPASPFDALKADPSGPLTFGRRTFRIKTRSVLGSTSIALSFWAGGIPVDEMVVPVCISSEAAPPACGPSRPLTVGLRGVDSIRLGAERKGALLPDGALHIIKFDSATLRGVFRCNTCPDWAKDYYAVWPLDKSMDEVTSYIGQTLPTDLDNANVTDDDISLIAHGEDLFAEFFGGKEDENKDQDAARKRFLDFVSSKALSNQGPGLHPSLFVRVLGQNSESLPVLPVGLMRVPLGNGSEDFLGFYFRVETPLQRQNYETPHSCISSWRLLVPSTTTGNSMDQARKPFGPWIDSFTAWGSHAVVDQGDIKAFSLWLKSGTIVTDPTAILILSHHDLNRLYFMDPGDTIETPNLQLRFSAPSLVILDACGTGQPGATEFMRTFNKQGVSAVIATDTAVRLDMAGDFASILMRQFSNNPGITLGDAEFEAIGELSGANESASQSQIKYGARALEFVLVGNGNLTLCVPPPPKPSSER